MTKKDPTRVRLLKQGAELTQGQRQEAYGQAVVNMTHMAGLLTAYFKNIIQERGNNSKYNHYIFKAEDAAQIMTLAKLSRTANRGVPYHEDNYTDQAVYSAIAGECAEVER